MYQITNEGSVAESGKCDACTLTERNWESSWLRASVSLLVKQVSALRPHYHQRGSKPGLEPLGLVFSVGGVWPQLSSHLGMQLKVWLVYKHPSTKVAYTCIKCVTRNDHILTFGEVFKASFTWNSYSISFSHFVAH